MKPIKIKKLGVEENVNENTKVENETNVINKERRMIKRKLGKKQSSDSSDEEEDTKKVLKKIQINMNTNVNYNFRNKNKKNKANAVENEVLYNFRNRVKRRKNSSDNSRIVSHDDIDDEKDVAKTEESEKSEDSVDSVDPQLNRKSYLIKKDKGMFKRDMTHKDISEPITTNNGDHPSLTR